MAARIVGIWLALVATAQAEPRTDAGLVWQAPATCPDAAELRARIERRLGMPIERAVHGVEVAITTEGEGRRFVARIDLRGVTLANEIRVLTSARCDELTDAVAVVIARIAAESRPAPGEVRSAGAQLVVTALPQPAATPRRWGWGVRGLGVSGIGALPGVGLGGELAGYARVRAAFAELSATRWLPGQHVLQAGAPGRVDVGLDVIALRIGWRSEQLPLRAWLAGELGSVEGKGVALENEQVGHGRWTGVGTGFAVAWPMAPYARLVGMLELGVPLERARFLLQDGVELYRPGAVTVRSGLGLELGW